MGSHTKSLVVSIDLLGPGSAESSITPTKEYTTPIALRAARVLPKSKADFIEDGVVVVESDRIIAVETWAELGENYASSVRELGNVTLMPGLFDCHVHLQLNPLGVSTDVIVSSVDDELLPLMAKHATKLLDAGVTTARDLGSSRMNAITIRGRIARGDIPGPRLQCANAPITVPGGHCCSMGGPCEGVEGVRAEVRKRVAVGADLIKVKSTGGFMAVGIRLVTGTDAGIGLCRFERFTDGLFALSDAGYTTRESVSAATETAAELYGLGSESGRLEPGFAAYVVAFAGNPLEDLAAFFEARFVMALGREYETKPIEPLGNIKEQADQIFELLRKGAA